MTYFKAPDIIKLCKICFLFCFAFVNFCQGQSNVGESKANFLTSEPPGVPLPVSPSNGEEDVTLNCLIVWNSQIHTSSYSLHVSEYPDFSTLMVNQTNLADPTFLLSALKDTSDYYWRVNAKNVAGESSFSPVMAFTTGSDTGIQDIQSVPYSCWMQSPYPNPFRKSITIVYSLRKQSNITITIYNDMGQAVRELISETKEPGEYTVSWDGADNQGADLPGGHYVGVFSAEKDFVSKTFLLIK